MTTTTGTAAAPHPIDTGVQTPAGQVRRSACARYALGVTRIMLGWMFLWGFLDKLFGLGKYTPSGQGWIEGGSPTGVFFAQFKHNGPFLDSFRSVAGTALADTLFMVGIGVVAVGLTVGIGLRITAVVGILLLATMEIASIWPPGNPFMTQHWINAVMLILFAASGAGNTLGLGRLTSKVPWLR